MTITADQFADTVRERAGLPDRSEADRAAADVLAVLGGQLTGAAARRLAEGLPDRYRAPLTQGGEVAGAGGLEEFYAAVAARSPGSADEVPALVAGVLRALVEVTAPAAVDAAREQLTAELRTLLQPRSSEQPTAQQQVAGPRDPGAQNLAGPEAPVERQGTEDAGVRRPAEPLHPDDPTTARPPWTTPEERRERRG